MNVLKIFRNICTFILTFCIVLIIIPATFGGAEDFKNSPTRVRRSAMLDNLWTRNNPYGIVFIYSNDFPPSEVSTIISAAKEILKYSCIDVNVYPYTKFILSGGISNPLFRNVVYITRDSYYGCSATIGMAGGMQRMNLDPVEQCTSRQSAIMHEMIHSLGIDHEQNRPDRDQFVRINFDNVMTGKEYNFQIKRFARAIGPYDYSSIMQYGAYAFARNNYHPTISSKLPGFIVPQWAPAELSAIDKQKIKFITGCKVAF